MFKTIDWWAKLVFHQQPCFQLMVICIHAVCHVRWKPSINSQFFSVSSIMPPVFTFSFSSQGCFRPTAAGTGPGESVRSPAVNKVLKTNVWQKSENEGFLMLPTSWLWMCGTRGPSVILSVLTSDEKQTPVRRWNTSDALIYSLILAWLHTDPQRDACSHTRCSKQSH